MVGVRQFDETKVLEAVLDVFWRKGWQGTSMADLADATRVQRGSLYNAYGGKEELFLLAFDAYATRFLGDAKMALGAPTAEEALHRFFDVAITNMTRGKPARGCLTTKTAAQSEATTGQIQERLRELMNALRKMIVAEISRPDLKRALRPSPEEAADLLVTFTRGLAVMERIYGDSSRLRRSAALLVTALLKDSR